MTREELYIEALEDSKSILIERGGYHSVISGGYKIIKDLNTQKNKSHEYDWRLLRRI